MIKTIAAIALGALATISFPFTGEIDYSQDSHNQFEKKADKWILPGGSHNERVTLDFLQGHGITDKYALATLMGNIKAESLFHTNICEGGARVSYNACRVGGYGLIQWTTENRYNGLKHFANKYGGDPNSLATQLRYMFNEGQFQNNLHVWKTPGLSIQQYMDAAYRWLGWGVHGHRTTYAQQYLAKFTR